MDRKRRRFRMIPVIAFLALISGLTAGCDVVVDIEEFLRTVFNCECACHCFETYLSGQEQTAGGSLRCVNRTNPNQTCGDVCTNLSIGQSLGSGSLVVCQ